MSQSHEQPPIRLAELLAVLSLGADLGLGLPMEHVMRQSLIALRLGDRLGLDESERSVLYYVSLLSWVGCHVDAYEQAKWFGDDQAMKRSVRMVDNVGITGLLNGLSQLGTGRPLLERVRTGLAFFTGGMRDAEMMLANHWYAVDDLAGRLGLDQEVRDSLAQTFERWDGKGSPGDHKGEDLVPSARLVALADVLEVFHQSGGVAGAVEVARARSGTQFDPALVEIACQDAELLFSDLDAVTHWDAIIEAEPGLSTPLSDQHLDACLEAMADFTDVKSPYTLGHSRAVAELAAEAARVMGFSPADVRLVRRAALVHDLGRLGVSNAVWDKRGSLTAAEMERVRIHPYLTDRMLASSPGLAVLGEVAVQHHERLDGSGYPRGLSGEAISPLGRVLAATDMYCAKTEPRPHRPSRSADEAAADLRDEVRAGRLDGPAVEAVLRAAGHAVKRRQDWPAGLTAREVEVLRLVARGFSNKEIAEELVISKKTAGNHVEHIYAKIGVSNRARASLFAMKHGLMQAATADATS
jgi:putative nucleotidyltransferase with HDIG domain